MSDNLIILWKGADLPVLPKKIQDISHLVTYGLQLSKKDQIQIVRTFNEGSYEMVSTYIWTKAILSLKAQLGKMGISFIAEMLDRPDINEYSNLQQAISELEAIRLAEELGVINGTAAFRLRQAMETVSHFNRPDLDESEEEELTEDEAKTIIRSCIQGVLGYNKIEAAIDFKHFRSDLEAVTFRDDSPYLLKLIQSPYFFHRTTLRILLSLVKSTTGAQLENALANTNLIIPLIWTSLKHPEKYQVGRTYSELFADGKTKASSGLKQLLLKVKGFDFVPEDLRSSSFIKAANEVLTAHEGINNFYNEPVPTNALSRMGSVIPIPAFPACITAILSVRLGNKWGVSHAAQDSALNIIKTVSRDRWVYFFNECLSSNDRILYKLTLNNPSSRWMELFKKEMIDEILPQITNRDSVNILKFTRDNKQEKINKIALEMYSKLGYSQG
jgi:hypothetical protein